MHTYIHAYMTKVISISDEAYNKLKKLKNGMSFTEVIIELSKCKEKDILEFAGSWTDKEALKIKKEIMAERKTKSRRA